MVKLSIFEVAKSNKGLLFGTLELQRRDHDGPPRLSGRLDVCFRPVSSGQEENIGTWPHDYEWLNYPDYANDTLVEVNSITDGGEDFVVTYCFPQAAEISATHATGPGRVTGR